MKNTFHKKFHDKTYPVPFLYLVHLSCALVIILGLISCTGRSQFKMGNEAMQHKDWDKAVEFYLKALHSKPSNIQYRLSLVDAMLSASYIHTEKGKLFFVQRRFNRALREFEKAIEYNPENNIARNKKLTILRIFQEREQQQRKKNHLAQVKANAQNQKQPPQPQLKYPSKSFSLQFRGTDLLQILKVLQKSSGIDFIYDPAFKSRRIELNLQDVQFLDALQKIMIQSQSFFKVLDAKTVLIIPDTPAKRREYEDLVMRTFFLSDADPEEIRKILVPLTGIKAIAVDKNLNTLTAKGTIPQVQLVEKLVNIHDKPRGELFVDVEIIEVNRNRVKEYGIELSSYQVSETYLPLTGSDTDITDSGSTIRLNMISHTDTSDYLLSLPSVSYKLLKSDSESRIKARPKLRVLDMEEVKIKLGDKVPIPTTSFVPYNTGGPAQQPITSYNLEDIGINIKLKPRIHHDGLVTLKMEFELTFITRPGSGGVPPTIGNRSITTVIKLRDNETSILAGLIRDTERRSMSGFPLISQVPILKEIFGGNRREIEQTDIILTITPRIIRFPEIAEHDLEYIWSGTIQDPGLQEPIPGLEIMEDATPQPPGVNHQPPQNQHPPITPIPPKKDDNKK